jgi:hypothetical protein
MKVMDWSGRRFRKVWVPVSLGIALAPALACERGLPEVSVEEGGRIVEIAEPVANELLRTLVGRLTSSLEEGGPTHAIEFCSTEALPLTAAVQAGVEGGLALKRTSFRFRNPENAPDEAEEAALLHFEEALLAGGQAPPSYVQRVSEDELRYYKPLFVAEMCVQCHGDPDLLDPGVRQALAERYPGDLATGYEVGGFRGVVRVSVPAERLGEG